MFTIASRKIREINNKLHSEMLAKGCTFHTGERYQSYRDANNDYVSYPPGYIRGIGSTTMSVQGHNGWHQRTFQSIAAAEEWAAKTAEEVLAEKPAEVKEG